MTMDDHQETETGSWHGGRAQQNSQWVFPSHVWTIGEAA
jgi:hypothetical protein